MRPVQRLLRVRSHVERSGALDRRAAGIHSGTRRRQHHRPRFFRIADVPPMARRSGTRSPQKTAGKSAAGGLQGGLLGRKKLAISAAMAVVLISMAAIYLTRRG